MDIYSSPDIDIQPPSHNIHLNIIFKSFQGMKRYGSSVSDSKFKGSGICLKKNIIGEPYNFNQTLAYIDFTAAKVLDEFGK